jgi:hypothetical protein
MGKQLKTFARQFRRTRQLQQEAAAWQQKYITATRSRLIELFQNSYVLFWEVDFTENTIRVNAATANFLGYPFHAIALTPIVFWKNLLKEEDFAKALYKAQNIPREQQKQPLVWEIAMQHQQGHWLQVRSVFSVTETSPEGHPLKLLGTIHDLSNRLRFEEQLSRHDILGSLVSYVSSLLINTDHLEEKLSDCLRLLGNYINADHTFIYITPNIDVPITCIEWHSVAQKQQTAKLFYELFSNRLPWFNKQKK